MTTNTAAADAYIDDQATWSSLNLDPRLLQAIQQVGFERPTLVQSHAIPLAINDKKDIIAKASTGSGKTAAYCIPIINAILVNELANLRETSSVILVPTRELASQVTKFIESLLVYCNNKINAINLSFNLSDQVLTTLLINRPDIIVSTPAKLVQVLEKNVNSDLINLSTVKNLTIDEVDLIMSYGYADDLQALESFLPSKKNLQTFMMSATINEDLDSLKERFCTKPAILKLNDEKVSQSKLVQFFAKTTEFDKFLLAYVIFKLNLIKGKTLVFVNSIDRGYRLKLFLEQFGVRCCILNSELPINSRIHIAEEFNKNVYNLLIATDESNEWAAEQDEHDELAEEAPDQKALTSKKNKKNKKAKQDKEYGVTRGADFHNVACVLNFDLPSSSKAYIHRVGRTARAGKAGMALSFMIPETQVGKHKTAALVSAKKDEAVMRRIVKQQLRNGFEIKPYQFDMTQVEGFRYRAEDAFRAVTLTAIREARVKELKSELINSEKLKRFFEENPQDLATLRHDKELHPSRVQSHLKWVPDYLLPESARQSIKDIGFVPYHKQNRVSKLRKHKGRKSDPLKSFKRRN